MPHSSRARVFMSGRSQHVTIPREFRFRSSLVSIRRDQTSGDVILSEVPALEDVFEALDEAGIPEDFLSDRDRRPPQARPEVDRIFSGSEERS